MIYAKCIWDVQIARNKDDFFKRQNEKHHVYCIGETTICKNNTQNLCCVPLNFIYDCLKYGNYIAIIDIDDYSDYPTVQYYTNALMSSNQQKITKILKADSIEAIDFLFENVKDISKIKYGYIDTLSRETREYFKKRLMLKE